MAATLVHAQYNSPLPLYSNDAVKEELQRAAGQHSPRADSGQRVQSGAYSLIHSPERLPAEHSATLDEPSNAEYPSYKGFVDPNLQSPSFKRLQRFSGSAGRADGQIGSPARSGSPAAHAQWYPDEPAVAQRDPGEPGEQPLGAEFALKIAQAERPHVPPVQVPSWVNKARVKQQQWRSSDDQYDQHSPPPAVPPNMLNRPSSVFIDRSAGADKWQQQQQQYGSSTKFRAHSAGATVQQRRPAAPAGGVQPKEPWLRPYIAPNVLGAKFAAGSPATRKFYQSSSDVDRTSATSRAGFGFGFGGTYYGPPSPVRTFSPPPPQRQQQQQRMTSSGSWRSETAAPGLASGDQALFAGEQEAWRRMAQMEQELQRRAARPPAPPQDDRAADSTTKSHTQGSFLDERGNRVSYERDVLTSAASGGEAGPGAGPGSGVGAGPGAGPWAESWTGLSEQDQPLQPGVVSRHVTSKYYKRSTFTSQTTTSGVQAPPIFSSPAPAPPTSAPYTVGSLAPGLSQF